MLPCGEPRWRPETADAGSTSWNRRALEDDPNVTDKKLPGNPTRSYRTREPVRVVGEITDWTGHSDEQLQAMRDTLAELRRRGLDVIYD